MKINPEVGTLINIVKQGDKFEKKSVDANAQRKTIADFISLENRQASSTKVENVEDAKEMLSQVVDKMPSQSTNLYTLNLQRVMSLIQ